MREIESLIPKTPHWLLYSGFYVIILSLLLFFIFSKNILYSDNIILSGSIETYNKELVIDSIVRTREINRYTLPTTVEMRFIACSKSKIEENDINKIKLYFLDDLCSNSLHTEIKIDSVKNIEINFDENLDVYSIKIEFKTKIIKQDLNYYNGAILVITTDKKSILSRIIPII